MHFRYEELEVWQQGVELYRRALPLITKLPVEERFGLASQIREALLSTILNIAEGTGRLTKPDFRRFIRQAIGSLVEADAGLKLAVAVGYLQTSDYDSLVEAIESVYYKLIGLEKSLR